MQQAMRQDHDWPTELSSDHEMMKAHGLAKAVAKSHAMSNPAARQDPPSSKNAEHRVQCFIVAGRHEAERNSVADLARESGYAVGLALDLDELKTQPAYSQSVQPLVILLDSDSPSDQAEAATRFAEQEAGHCYLVYVTETISPEDYKRLVRTQRAEWCRREGLPRELADIAQRVSSAEGTARGGARIVSFFPSKGGVGNTTLAVEAAIHLARLRKRGARIAILDLDLEGGTLADALDVEPRFDIREIVGVPERLDNQLIDIFTSRHSEGVDVFASPRRRAGAAEVDPQMIFAVLDLLASRYDLILLDIPNQRLPFVDNLLQGSDGVVLSGDSTVPALKQIAAKLSHLDDLSVDRAKLLVAVNHCQTDFLGRVVRRVEIARALPGRQISFIRQDVASVRDASNAGRPLAELHPGSRVSKDMRKMAEWIGTAVEITRGTRS